MLGRNFIFNELPFKTQAHIPLQVLKNIRSKPYCTFSIANSKDLTTYLSFTLFHWRPTIITVSYFKIVLCSAEENHITSE